MIWQPRRLARWERTRHCLTASEMLCFSLMVVIVAAKTMHRNLNPRIKVGTTTLRDPASFLTMEPNDRARKVSLVNRYVQSICGLYSRVARQLRVDRSYVSRVARGERRSEPIELALSNEFDRIMNESEG